MGFEPMASTISVQCSPSWLVGSVGRALHQHRRGHGFKSRAVLDFFFKPDFNYRLSSVHYCCKDRFNNRLYIMSYHIQ